MYYFYFTVDAVDFSMIRFSKWAESKKITVGKDSIFYGNDFSGNIEKEGDKIKIVFNSKPHGLQEEVFVKEIKKYLGEK